MKSLLTCLVFVFAVSFVTSCSNINDEDITPEVNKKKVEKFDVKSTTGGDDPEPGDPGDD